MKPGRHSPVIYHYLKKYQDDPNSRVFAPLAEAYRKAGLVNEAVEIAREGLRVHPHFVGGRVALARALFDKELYAEVVEELSKVVQDVPDNLAAQRLLAESCLMLGRVAEALGAYKMLLFFAPQDTETARLVQELELQAYDEGTLVLRTDPRPPKEQLPEFSERDASVAFGEDPSLKRAQWIRRIELLQGLLQKVERYRVRD
ncbi:tetratricopeptide repeat protein [Bdellovibrionota bacterium FG-1]